MRGTGETGSLEELLLRHASGEDVSRLSARTRPPRVMMIPIPTPGRVQAAWRASDAARAVPTSRTCTITAKPDQLLEPLPEGASYLGFIFARAPRRRGGGCGVREAHGRLRFAIDPASRFERGRCGDRAG